MRVGVRDGVGVRVGGGARARVRVRRPVASPQRYESRAADVYAPFG